MSYQQLSQTDPSAVDQMLETYQRSIATNPNVRIYENLALLLQVKGKAAEARSLLQKLIHENPGLNDTRALLAYLDDSSK
jgi:tetratricopeptide (TPR) repeat protein